MQNDEVNFSLDFFMDGNNNVNLPIYPEAEQNVPKKRGRKKKVTGEGVEIVTAEEVSTNLPMCMSNEPYSDTYQDTNLLLHNTVREIDELYGTIRGDIESIRGNKTIKNKFDNISKLAGTEGALLSTKIAAIKELNKSKTDSHNLELNRMSKGMAMAGQQQDDTKIISDMYNALIQTPIGAGGANPFGLPSGQDMTLGTGLVTGSLAPGDMGYAQYMSNPSPEQATIMAANNPNIKTVVIYDEYAPVGQNVRFEIIDSSTNMPVPNVPRPDPMFLADLKIEPSLGIATNNNLGQTYDLIMVNHGPNPLAQY